MVATSQLTELAGWTSVINIGYLFLATLILMFMRETIFYNHSKMFKIDEKKLISKYFNFLRNYKVVTLAFMVTPYIKKN